MNEETMRKHYAKTPKETLINILITSREQIEKYKDIVLDLELVDKDKEIERLHSIINEFMEELKWQRKVSLSLNEAFAVSRIDTLINKLQELKGSDKDE